MSCGTDRLAALQRSGRRFRVNESDNLGLFALDEFFRFAICVSLTPGLLEAHDVRAVALRHLREPVGEKSVGKYRQLSSGLHEVNDSSFHARASGAGNHQRRAVAGSIGYL